MTYDVVVIDERIIEVVATKIDALLIVESLDAAEEAAHIFLARVFAE